MFCNKCGTQLPEDSGFCHKCGAKLIKDAAAQHTSVKPVAPTDLHNSNEKYCVTLDNAGSRKIEVIKVVRELTGLGLAEAKELVDNAPKALKAGLTRTEAETIKSTLANIGATATLAISDAEQIVYQNAKPRSAGVLQMALAPLLIASIVAGFMNEGLLGTILIIVPIVIILIWSVIGIITSIKSKTKNLKKLLLGMAGIVVVVIAAIVFTLNLGGGGKYPNELLYEGLPVTRFLEMTRDDVIAEFGAPGQDFNGWDSYEDKGIYSIYYNESSGEVLFIRLNAAYCSFNGTKLRERTYEQIMKLISSPERMFSGLTTITSDSVESGLYSTGRKFFRSTFRPDQGYTLDFITTLYNSKDTLIDIALYADEWSWLGSDTATVTGGGTGADTTNSNSGEALYNGISLSGFLGEPIQEWVKTFGEADWEHDWFLMYEDKFAPQFDNQNYPHEIYAIEGITPSMVEINGITLDKTRAELVSIFGEPSNEYFDEGYGDTFTPGYNYTYDMEHYSFTVTSENDGDKPYAVAVRKIYEDVYGYEGDDDGGYEEDYGDNLPALPDGLEWVEEPSLASYGNGYWYFTCVIKNTSDREIRKVIFHFVYYDENGYQISDFNESVDDLRSGIAARLETPPFSAKPHSWELLEVSARY